MSSKLYLKILLASFLVGIGISFVGCGSSGNGGVAVPPASSIAPTFSVISGQTPQNCYTGIVKQAVDGATVCQTTVLPQTSVNYSIYGSVALPLVRPSLPSSGYAYPTGVSLAVNDKLTLISVGGGWGPSGDCSRVSFSGYDSALGTVAMNDGQPQGFFVSSGVAAYPAFGSGAIYFRESGPLYFGYNAPITTGCASMKLTLRIDRCLDVAGQPHKCQ